MPKTYYEVALHQVVQDASAIGPYKAGPATIKLLVNVHGSGTPQGQCTLTCDAFDGATTQAVTIPSGAPVDVPVRLKATPGARITLKPGTKTRAGNATSLQVTAKAPALEILKIEHGGQDVTAGPVPCGLVTVTVKATGIHASNGAPVVFDVEGEGVAAAKRGQQAPAPNATEIPQIVVPDVEVVPTASGDLELTLTPVTNCEAGPNATKRLPLQLPKLALGKLEQTNAIEAGKQFWVGKARVTLTHESGSGPIPPGGAKVKLTFAGLDAPVTHAVMPGQPATLAVDVALNKGTGGLQDFKLELDDAVPEKTFALGAAATVQASVLAPPKVKLTALEPARPNDTAVPSAWLGELTLRLALDPAAKDVPAGGAVVTITSPALAAPVDHTIKPDDEASLAPKVTLARPTDGPVEVKVAAKERCEVVAGQDVKTLRADLGFKVASMKVVVTGQAVTEGKARLGELEVELAPDGGVPEAEVPTFPSNAKLQLTFKHPGLAADHVHAFESMVNSKTVRLKLAHATDHAHDLLIVCKGVTTRTPLHVLRPSLRFEMPAALLVQDPSQKQTVKVKLLDADGQDYAAAGVVFKLRSAGWSKAKKQAIKDGQASLDRPTTFDDSFDAPQVVQLEAVKNCALDADAATTRLTVQTAPRFSFARDGWLEPAEGPFFEGERVKLKVLLSGPGPEGGAKVNVSGPDFEPAGGVELTFAKDDTQPQTAELTVKAITGDKKAATVKLEAVSNCRPGDKVERTIDLAGKPTVGFAATPFPTDNPPPYHVGDEVDVTVELGSNVMVTKLAQDATCRINSSTGVLNLAALEAKVPVTIAKVNAPAGPADHKKTVKVKFARSGKAQLYLDECVNVVGGARKKLTVEVLKKIGLTYTKRVPDGPLYPGDVVAFHFDLDTAAEDRDQVATLSVQDGTGAELLRPAEDEDPSNPVGVQLPLKTEGESKAAVVEARIAAIATPPAQPVDVNVLEFSPPGWARPIWPKPTGWKAPPKLEVKAYPTFTVELVGATARDDVFTFRQSEKAQVKVTLSGPAPQRGAKLRVRARQTRDGQEVDLPKLVRAEVGDAAIIEVPAGETAAELPVYLTHEADPRLNTVLVVEPVDACQGVVKTRVAVTGQQVLRWNRVTPFMPERCRQGQKARLMLDVLGGKPAGDLRFKLVAPGLLFDPAQLTIPASAWDSPDWVGEHGIDVDVQQAGALTYALEAEGDAYVLGDGDQDVRRTLTAHGPLQARFAKNKVLDPDRFDVVEGDRATIRVKLSEPYRRPPAVDVDPPLVRITGPCFADPKGYPVVFPDGQAEVKVPVEFARSTSRKKVDVKLEVLEQDPPPCHVATKTSFQVYVHAVPKARFAKKPVLTPGLDGDKWKNGWKVYPGDELKLKLELNKAAGERGHTALILSKAFGPDEKKQLATGRIVDPPPEAARRRHGDRWLLTDGHQPPHGNWPTIDQSVAPLARDAVVEWHETWKVLGVPAKASLLVEPVVDEGQLYELTAIGKPWHRAWGQPDETAGPLREGAVVLRQGDRWKVLAATPRKGWEAPTRVSGTLHVLTDPERLHADWGAFDERDAALEKGCVVRLETGFRTVRWKLDPDALWPGKLGPACVPTPRRGQRYVLSSANAAHATWQRWGFETSAADVAKDAQVVFDGELWRVAPAKVDPSTHVPGLKPDDRPLPSARPGQRYVLDKGGADKPTPDPRWGTVDTRYGALVDGCVVVFTGSAWQVRPDRIDGTKHLQPGHVAAGSLPPAREGQRYVVTNTGAADPAWGKGTPALDESWQALQDDAVLEHDGRRWVTFPGSLDGKTLYPGKKGPTALPPAAAGQRYELTAAVLDPGWGAVDCAWVSPAAAPAVGHVLVYVASRRAWAATPAKVDMGRVVPGTGLPPAARGQHYVVTNVANALAGWKPNNKAVDTSWGKLLDDCHVEYDDAKQRWAVVPWAIDAKTEHPGRTELFKVKFPPAADGQRYKLASHAAKAHKGWGKIDTTWGELVDGCVIECVAGTSWRVVRHAVDPGQTFPGKEHLLLPQAKHGQRWVLSAVADLHPRWGKVDTSFGKLEAGCTVEYDARPGGDPSKARWAVVPFKVDPKGVYPGKKLPRAQLGQRYQLTQTTDLHRTWGEIDDAWVPGLGADTVVEFDGRRWVAAPWKVAMDTQAPGRLAEGSLPPARLGDQYEVSVEGSIKTGGKWGALDETFRKFQAGCTLWYDGARWVVVDPTIDQERKFPGFFDHESLPPAARGQRYLLTKAPTDPDAKQAWGTFHDGLGMVGANKAVAWSGSTWYVVGDSTTHAYVEHAVTFEPTKTSAEVEVRIQDVAQTAQKVFVVPAIRVALPSNYRALPLRVLDKVVRFAAPRPAVVGLKEYRGDKFLAGETVRGVDSGATGKVVSVQEGPDAEKGTLKVERPLCPFLLDEEVQGLTSKAKAKVDTYEDTHWIAPRGPFAVGDVVTLRVERSRRGLSAEPDPTGPGAGWPVKLAEVTSPAFGTDGSGAQRKYPVLFAKGEALSLPIVVPLLAAGSGAKSKVEFWLTAVTPTFTNAAEFTYVVRGTAKHWLSKLQPRRKARVKAHRWCYFPKNYAEKRQAFALHAKVPLSLAMNAPAPRPFTLRVESRAFPVSQHARLSHWDDKKPDEAWRRRAYPVVFRTGEQHKVVGLDGDGKLPDEATTHKTVDELNALRRHPAVGERWTLSDGGVLKLGGASVAKGDVVEAVERAADGAVWVEWQKLTAKRAKVADLVAMKAPPEGALFVLADAGSLPQGAPLALVQDDVLWHDGARWQKLDRKTTLELAGAAVAGTIAVVTAGGPLGALHPEPQAGDVVAHDGNAWRSLGAPAAASLDQVKALVQPPRDATRKLTDGGELVQPGRLDVPRGGLVRHDGAAWVLVTPQRPLELSAVAVDWTFVSAEAGLVDTGELDVVVGDVVRRDGEAWAKVAAQQVAPADVPGTAAEGTVVLVTSAGDMPVKARVRRWDAVRYTALQPNPFVKLAGKTAGALLTAGQGNAADYGALEDAALPGQGDALRVVAGAAVQFVGGAWALVVAKPIADLRDLAAPGPGATYQVQGDPGELETSLGVEKDEVVRFDAAAGWLKVATSDAAGLANHKELGATLVLTEDKAPLPEGRLVVKAGDAAAFAAGTWKLAAVKTRGDVAALPDAPADGDLHAVTAAGRAKRRTILGVLKDTPLQFDPTTRDWTVGVIKTRDEAEVMPVTDGQLVRVTSAGTLTHGRLEVKPDDHVVFDGTRWVPFEVAGPEQKTAPELNAMDAPADGALHAISAQGYLRTSKALQVAAGDLVTFESDAWSAKAAAPLKASEVDALQQPAAGTAHKLTEAGDLPDPTGAPSARAVDDVVVRVDEGWETVAKRTVALVLGAPAADGDRWVMEDAGHLGPVVEVQVDDLVRLKGGTWFKAEEATVAQIDAIPQAELVDGLLRWLSNGGRLEKSHLPVKEHDVLRGEQGRWVVLAPPPQPKALDALYPVAPDWPDATPCLAAADGDLVVLDEVAPLDVLRWVEADKGWRKLEKKTAVELGQPAQQTDGNVFAAADDGPVSPGAVDVVTHDVVRWDGAGWVKQAVEEKLPAAIGQEASPAPDALRRASAKGLVRTARLMASSGDVVRFDGVWRRVAGAPATAAEVAEDGAPPAGKVYVLTADGEVAPKVYVRKGEVARWDGVRWARIATTPKSAAELGAERANGTLVSGHYSLTTEGLLDNGTRAIAAANTALRLEADAWRELPRADVLTVNGLVDPAPGSLQTLTDAGKLKQRLRVAVGDVLVKSGADWRRGTTSAASTNELEAKGAAPSTHVFSVAAGGKLAVGALSVKKGDLVRFGDGSWCKHGAPPTTVTALTLVPPGRLVGEARRVTEAGTAEPGGVAVQVDDVIVAERAWVKVPQVTVDDLNRMVAPAQGTTRVLSADGDVRLGAFDALEGHRLWFDGTVWTMPEYRTIKQIDAEAAPRVDDVYLVVVDPTELDPKDTLSRGGLRPSEHDLVRFDGVAWGALAFTARSAADLMAAPLPVAPEAVVIDLGGAGPVAPYTNRGVAAGTVLRFTGRSWSPAAVATLDAPGARARRDAGAVVKLTAGGTLQPGGLAVAQDDVVELAARWRKPEAKPCKELAGMAPPAAGELRALDDAETATSFVRGARELAAGAHVSWDDTARVWAPVPKATVAEVNGLGAPADKTARELTDAGDLTTGGVVAVVAGDVARFDGAGGRWEKVVAPAVRSAGELEQVAALLPPASGTVAKLGAPGGFVAPMRLDAAVDDVLRFTDPPRAWVKLPALSAAGVNARVSPAPGSLFEVGADPAPVNGTWALSPLGDPSAEDPLTVQAGDKVAFDGLRWTIDAGKHQVVIDRAPIAPVTTGSPPTTTGDPAPHDEIHLVHEVGCPMVCVFEALTDAAGTAVQAELKADAAIAVVDALTAAQPLATIEAPEVRPGGDRRHVLGNGCVVLSDPWRVNAGSRESVLAPPLTTTGQLAPRFLKQNVQVSGVATDVFARITQVFHPCSFPADGKTSKGKKQVAFDIDLPAVRFHPTTPVRDTGQGKRDNRTGGLVLGHGDELDLVLVLDKPALEGTVVVVACRDAGTAPTGPRNVLGLGDDGAARRFQVTIEKGKREAVQRVKVEGKGVPGDAEVVFVVSPASDVVQAAPGRKTELRATLSALPALVFPAGPALTGEGDRGDPWLDPPEADVAKGDRVRLRVQLAEPLPEGKTAKAYLRSKAFGEPVPFELQGGGDEPPVAWIEATATQERAELQRVFLTTSRDPKAAPPEDAGCVPGFRSLRALRVHAARKVFFTKSGLSLPGVVRPGYKVTFDLDEPFALWTDPKDPSTKIERHHTFKVEDLAQDELAKLPPEKKQQRITPLGQPLLFREEPDSVRHPDTGTVLYAPDPIDVERFVPGDRVRFDVALDVPASNDGAKVQLSGGPLAAPATLEFRPGQRNRRIALELKNAGEDLKVSLGTPQGCTLGTRGSRKVTVVLPKASLPPGPLAPAEAWAGRFHWVDVALDAKAPHGGAAVAILCKQTARATGDAAKDKMVLFDLRGTFECLGADCDQTFTVDEEGLARDVGACRCGAEQRPYLRAWVEPGKTSIRVAVRVRFDLPEEALGDWELSLVADRHDRRRRGLADGLADERCKPDADKAKATIKVVEPPRVRFCLHAQDGSGEGAVQGERTKVEEVVIRQEPDPANPGRLRDVKRKHVHLEDKAAIRWTVGDTATLRLQPTVAPSEPCMVLIRSRAFGPKVYAVPLPAGKKDPVTQEVKFVHGLAEGEYADPEVFIPIVLAPLAKSGARDVLQADPNASWLLVRVKQPEVGLLQPCPKKRKQLLAGPSSFSPGQLRLRELEPPEEYCNLHRLFVTVEHGDEEKGTLTQPKRGSDRAGTFEVVRRLELAADREQALLNRPGEKVPVLEVIAGRKSDPKVEDEGTKFHTTRVKLALSKDDVFCSQDFVVPRITTRDGTPLKVETALHPHLALLEHHHDPEYWEYKDDLPLTVRDKVEPDLEKDTTPEKQAERRQSKVLELEVHQRSHWWHQAEDTSWGGKKGWVPHRLLRWATGSVSDLMSALSLMAFSPKRYEVLVRSCGRPAGGDLAGPTESLAFQLAVYPSDEFALCYSFSSGLDVHKGFSGALYDPARAERTIDKQTNERVKEEDYQKDPNAFSDPNRYERKQVDVNTKGMDDDQRKRGVDVALDMESSVQSLRCGRLRGNALLESGKDYPLEPRPEPPELRAGSRPSLVFHPVSFQPNNQPAWEVDYNESAQDANAADGFWGGDKTLFGMATGKDDALGRETNLSESWHHRLIEGQAKTGFKGSVKLTRNGQEDPAYHQVANTIASIVYAVRAICDTATNFSSHFKYSLGWGVQFSCSFLEGAATAYWGYKESSDRRVFRWFALHFDLQLIRLSFAFTFGFQAKCLIAEFTAILYVKCFGSLDLHTGWERTEPYSVVPSWMDSWLACKFGFELGLRIVLFNEKLFHIGAALKTGLKIEFKVLNLEDNPFGIQYRGFFLGLSANFVFELATYKIVEKEHEFIAPHSPDYPMFEGALPWDTARGWGYMRMQLDRIWRKIGHQRQEIMLRVKEFQDLQLYMVENAKVHTKQVRDERTGEWRTTSLYLETTEKPGLVFEGFPTDSDYEEAKESWERNKRKWDAQWERCKAAFTDEDKKSKGRGTVAFSWDIQKKLVDRTAVIETALVTFLERVRALDELGKECHAVTMDFNRERQKRDQSGFFRNDSVPEDDPFLKRIKRLGEAPPLTRKGFEALPLDDVTEAITALKHWADKREAW